MNTTYMLILQSLHKSSLYQALLLNSIFFEYFNIRLALYLIYATENLFKIGFSHRESLPQICYVAKDGTELLIFLSLPPKHWDS